MTARTFYVEIYCKADRTADVLEAQLESVMDALQSEPGDADIDVASSDLSAGHVEFCVHVAAETVGEAVSRAVAMVRSALHSLGHRTPGWKQILTMLEQETAAVTARPSDDADFDPTGRTPSFA